MPIGDRNRTNVRGRRPGGRGTRRFLPDGWRTGYRGTGEERAKSHPAADVRVPQWVAPVHYTLFSATVSGSVRFPAGDDKRKNRTRGTVRTVAPVSPGVDPPDAHDVRPRARFGIEGRSEFSAGTRPRVGRTQLFGRLASLTASGPHVVRHRRGKWNPNRPHESTGLDPESNSPPNPSRGLVGFSDSPAYDAAVPAHPTCGRSLPEDYQCFAASTLRRSGPPCWDCS